MTDMTDIIVKLGCLEEKPQFTYDQGNPKLTSYYLLQSAVIPRPAKGIAYHKVTCKACGQEVLLLVHNPKYTFRRRLTAILASLLPLIGLALYRFKNDSFMAGFGLMLFLGLIWVVPLFLPEAFKKEHQLALQMVNREDPRHRLFEENVESVVSQTVA